MAAAAYYPETNSGLLGELMVENEGYAEAYIGCGVIGVVATVLLRSGLPEYVPTTQESPAPA